MPLYNQQGQFMGGGKGLYDTSGNLRSQEAPQPESMFNKIKDFGVGFLKGAGKSVVNMVESSPFTPLGITGLGKKPQLSDVKQQLEPTSTAQKMGGYAETGTELLAPLPGGKAEAGESLINTAGRIYESAMKPSTTLSVAERANIIKTGLQEGISLTQRGVEKLGERIDDLEGLLDEPIQQAAKAGAKVSMEYLSPFIHEAKKILGSTADPLFSDRAVSSIDNRFSALQSKYPQGIPVDEAQKLKVNTYRLIKKAYGKLSTSAVEYQKQAARGLKEGIVDAVPVAGNINQRLRNLYNFETQFSKSMGRIKNLNLVSLGGKVLSTGAGVLGKGAAVVHEIFGSAAVKSFGAIQMNRLGELLASKTPEETSALRTMAKTLGPVNAINFLHEIGSYFNSNSNE